MNTLMVPFDPATGWVSPDSNGKLGPGLTAHDVFQDGIGRVFRLLQLDSALIGNTTAAGQVLTYKTTGQLVTNDVSTGLDSTNPFAAGVVLGAIAEASSVVVTSTGAKFILVLVDGWESSVVTTGTVAIGDALSAAPGTDGAAATVVISATYSAAEVIKSLQSYVGWATTAATSNVASVYVKVKN